MTIAVEASRKQNGEDVQEKENLFSLRHYQGHKRAQIFSKKKLRTRPPYEGGRL